MIPGFLLTTLVKGLTGLKFRRKSLHDNKDFRIVRAMKKIKNKMMNEIFFRETVLSKKKEAIWHMK